MRGGGVSLFIHCLLGFLYAVSGRIYSFMDPGDAELAVKLGNMQEPMRNRHVDVFR